MGRRASGSVVLEVRGVSKRFPGVVALDRVDLDVRAGEVHVVLGENGAGKSTLMKILSGAYRKDDGEILIDGQPVEIRDPRHAQELGIAIIYQTFNQVPHLSVAENIRLAHPDASDAEVVRALDRIGALERFESLPNGIHTDVQTRGLRLSAGERQLVGIARVALADPAVIVLDEATSSLDPGTEVAVERALAAVAEGRTVVTIAHRLSTAERAERVVVMEHGRVVEVASHDELVEQGERYARLWASWQAGLAASGI